jgi:8-amino-7-oxononanoate synthase
VTLPAALERYQSALSELADQSRLRALEHRSGLDFTSNDYLGLAASRRLAGALADELRDIAV